MLPRVPKQIYTSNFHPLALEFLYRGSETELQVGKN